MPALLPMILTGSYLLLAADRIPQFDIDNGCHAARDTAIADNRSEDVCKQDERDARAKLEQEWGQFTSLERERCVALSRTGGPPSYVELLTCMEMADQANKLPPGDKLTGSAPK